MRTPLMLATAAPRLCASPEIRPPRQRPRGAAIPSMIALLVLLLLVAPADATARTRSIGAPVCPATTGGLARPVVDEPSPPSEYEAKMAEARGRASAGDYRSFERMAAQAGEILSSWATPRLARLQRAGEAEAARGGRVPPSAYVEILALQEMLAFHRLQDPDLKVASGILDAWSVARANLLEEAGTEVANLGQADPPPEGAELLELAAELDEERRSMGFASHIGRAPRHAGERVLLRWFARRWERMAEEGQALAANGGPETPPQIAAILELERRVECLGTSAKWAREPARAAARAVGEQHLEAYRARMRCPLTDPDRATYERLESRLVSFGWGPYENTLPRCSWSGTVTVTMTNSLNEEDSANHGAGEIRRKRELVQDIVVRIDVVDGQAIASIDGLERDRSSHTALVTQCMPVRQQESTLQTTRFQGGGAVPFEVEAVSDGQYLIRTSMPAYRETVNTTRHWKGNRCILVDGKALKVPEDGSDEESETSENDAFELLLQSKPLEIAALTGGEPLVVELEGSQEFRQSPRIKGKHLEISWKLTRH